MVLRLSLASRSQWLRERNYAPPNMICSYVWVLRDLEVVPGGMSKMTLGCGKMFERSEVWGFGADGGRARLEVGWCWLGTARGLYVRMQ